MELTNDFRVGVPIERAWAVLTDVELIAPCLPGAQLQEVEGDDYRGVVKVKVGPITAQYKGVARFAERDDAGHRAVLRAEGRDTRGQGNANATVTATLTPDGDGTRATVVTDLTVTGRVAQFGRGVMADVSAKLMGQFVECLEGKLLPDVAEGGDVPSAAGAAATAGDGGGGLAAAPGGEAQAPTPAQGAEAPALTPAETGHGPLDVASEGAEAIRLVEEGAATGGAGATASGDTALAAGAGSSEAGGAAGPSTTTTDDADRVAGTSGPQVRVVDSPEVEPLDLFEAAGAPVAKRALPAVAGLTVLWLLSVFLRRRRHRRPS